MKKIKYYILGIIVFLPFWGCIPPPDSNNLKESEKPASVLSTVELDSAIILKLNESRNISVSFKNKDGSEETKLVWRSLSPRVVTVDSNGKITAIGEGPGKIEVSSGTDNTKKLIFQVSVGAKGNISDPSSAKLPSASGLNTRVSNPPVTSSPRVAPTSLKSQYPTATPKTALANSTSDFFSNFLAATPRPTATPRHTPSPTASTLIIYPNPTHTATDIAPLPPD